MVLDVIKKRASVRAYDKSKKVSKEQIKEILKAASLAPSARNTQPWKFYIAESEGEKSKIMRAMSEHNAWASEASILIVILADLRNAYRIDEKKYYVDIGLCLENLLLEITNQRLAACPCAAFDREKLSKLLDLPAYLEPVVVVPIGYEAKGSVLAGLREKYGKVIERSEHKIGGTKDLKELIVGWR